uniref:DH domain-containing protein n=1 Tax=Plectus sambesii TaxID=2011161 RepID=A0A914WSI0_9BILA
MPRPNSLGARTITVDRRRRRRRPAVAAIGARIGNRPSARRRSTVSISSNKCTADRQPRDRAGADDGFCRGPADAPVVFGRGEPPFPSRFVGRWRAWNDRCKERRSSDHAPTGTVGRAPTLVLVVDCRQAQQTETLEVLRRCWQALCLLLQWVPASVSRMLWIGLEHGSDMERTVVDDDQTKAQLIKSDSVSLTALHEQLTASNLTMALEGEREAYGSQWVEFRTRLESFLRSTRALGELYIDLHKELRRVASNQLWSMDAAELDALKQSLTERKARIESSECFRFVRDEGESALNNLTAGYPDLAAFGADYYIKAVEKASGLFEEVRRIMDKASSTIDRRCVILDRHLRARQFLLQAREANHWADTVALPTANRQENEPSVSLMRLRIQDRQFEQFVAAAKQRLEAAEQLVLDNEWVKQSDSAFTEEQREEMCEAWNKLVEKTDETRLRLKEVRDRLADNLVCHHMLDRVYDWALHNAKWSSQLRLLISTAACSSSTGPNELKGLLDSVNQQISSYPSEELRQLPLYATRLSNEQVHSQAQALAIKCSAALQMLNKHEQQLKDMITALPDTTTVKARSVSPAETEYEQPIRRTAANPTPTPPSSARCEEALSEQQVRWRRSSYAGTASTSYDQVGNFYENLENRYRPSHRWSKNGNPGFDLFEEGQSDAPEQSTSQEDLTSGVITLDMTDQVVASMSANTLKKKISERRAANTGPQPPPNPLALLKGVRAGSARYVSKTKKPFRKLMKRSCTLDGALDQNLVPIRYDRPLIDSTPLPIITDHRHPSLASLTSIGEESVRSGSTESWSEAGRLNSANGTAHDDGCEGSCSLSWSPTSRHDDPIVRVKTLALDDYRSESPPPGVTPDQRMQHMILNELLQTEISYVKSLGHVIE